MALNINQVYSDQGTESRKSNCRLSGVNVLTIAHRTKKKPYANRRMIIDFVWLVFFSFRSSFIRAHFFFSYSTCCCLRFSRIHCCAHCQSLNVWRFLQIKKTNDAVRVFIMENSITLLLFNLTAEPFDF